MIIINIIIFLLLKQNYVITSWRRNEYLAYFILKKNHFHAITSISNSNPIFLRGVSDFSFSKLSRLSSLDKQTNVDPMTQRS